VPFPEDPDDPTPWLYDTKLRTEETATVITPFPVRAVKARFDPRWWRVNVGCVTSSRQKL
jgi:hypothetical protein